MAVEAMKQALEALRFALHVGFDESSESQIKKGDKAVRQHQDAITALRTAIETAEKQEPTGKQSLQVEQEPVGALILGGVIDTSDGPEYEEWDVEWNTKTVETLQEKLVTSNGVTLMLYTTPPAAQRQWVGLTDDDIWEVYKKHDSMQYMEFSRAVEAKLKEKNHG